MDANDWIVSEGYVRLSTTYHPGKPDSVRRQATPVA